MKDDVYNRVQTKHKQLSPFPNPKSEKGDSMSPALPPGRGRKVRGVQSKKDVYNCVQTKYKRLSPFSNPKLEKGAGDMHLEKSRRNSEHFSTKVMN